MSDAENSLFLVMRMDYVNPMKGLGGLLCYFCWPRTHGRFFELPVTYGAART